MTTPIPATPTSSPAGARSDFSTQYILRERPRQPRENLGILQRRRLSYATNSKNRMRLYRFWVDSRTSFKFFVKLEICLTNASITGSLGMFLGFFVHFFLCL